MQFAQSRHNMCGDNINSVHKMITLKDDERIIEAYCERCKNRYYVRKHQGRTDPAYNKIFKRDVLQRSSNLYYKEYPQNLNVI